MKTLKSIVRYLLGCRKSPMVVEDVPIEKLVTICPMCGKKIFNNGYHRCNNSGLDQKDPPAKPKDT